MTDDRLLRASQLSTFADWMKQRRGGVGDLDAAIKETPFSRLPRPETTKLNPLQEKYFREWVSARGITDLDAPESRYDYRGLWLSGGDGSPDAHFPDTFKQHGHPTFSVESRYSRGLGDGGQWYDDDTLIPADVGPRRRRP